MSYNLFLDDIRMPAEASKYMYITQLSNLYSQCEWEIVIDYDAFVRYIEVNGLPDRISFDHDLGDQHQKTGYDCAKWLMCYCEMYEHKIPTILCHSMNPVGKENILSLFKNHNK